MAPPPGNSDIDPMPEFYFCVLGGIRGLPPYEPDFPPAAREQAHTLEEGYRGARFSVMLRATRRFAPLFPHAASRSGNAMGADPQALRLEIRPHFAILIRS